MGVESRDEPGAPASEVIVRQSRVQRDGLFITLLALFALGPRGQTATLSGQCGDELRVASVGSGRYRSRGLKVRGASTIIPLSFFSMAEVRRQCVASGWRFEPRRPMTGGSAW
jgi:hypothetical protein